MLKRMYFFLLFILFFVFGANASSIDITWINQGTAYANSSCTVGGDIMLPNAPEKRGYTFKGWRVPKYQQLEYIESTGTQYIDTGYYYTDTTTWECDLAKLKNLNYATAAWPFFGYRFVTTATALGNMRYFFIYYDNRLAIRYGTDGKNISSTRTIASNVKTHITFDGTNLSADGTVFSYITSRYATTNFGKAYLFDANADGFYREDLNKFIGKMYYFKIFDNGILMRYFLPVRRTEDGAVGMFDLITQTFFENSGTGDFIAGPVIGYIE